VGVAAAVLAVAAVTAGAVTGARLASVAVKTRHTSLGTILVDAKGRTLYLFERDKGGKSACYGGCASFWPPYLATGKPTALGGAKKALLQTTRRRDGHLQVTYRGHPLYRYSADTKPGQTGGQGLDFFGGLWYVVSPQGARIVMPPASTTSGSSSDGGYGSYPG
jgi:predicted lipoprotein with Yx(FWY)xxD motif